jgi:RNA polymerase sigma-70 factor (ECF subfamily)
MITGNGQHSNYEDLSDEDLVGLVLEDKERYLYLMKRYEARLLRYIMGISGFDKDDAEDVLQESFISVYRNLRGFDRKRKFSSWIYRITRNATISKARKRSSRAKHVIPEVAEGLLERIASDEDISLEHDRRLEINLARSVLARLQDMHRDILVLYYLEGLEYAEISEVLRLPPGTVGSRLSRAKASFRKEYENNHSELT